METSETADKALQISPRHMLLDLLQRMEPRSVSIRAICPVHAETHDVICGLTEGPSRGSIEYSPPYTRAIGARD